MVSQIKKILANLLLPCRKMETKSIKYKLSKVYLPNKLIRPFMDVILVLLKASCQMKYNYYQTQCSEFVCHKGR